MMTDQNGTPPRLRLDKWLWAARFFRTRSLAKRAIEGGKVRCETERCKVSREIGIGTRLQIRQGWEEKEVIVRALSDQRRGADQAQQLYEETGESVQRREREAAIRKAARQGMNPGNERPSKRQRRMIHRFREQHSGDD